MKKLLLFLIFTLSLVVLVYIFKKPTVRPELENELTIEKNELEMSNPASENCIKNGGTSKIVSNKNGSQFGLCEFETYACEEWALMRGECSDLEGDAEKIRQALISKGLDLTNMKIEIKNHFGKYIGGSVSPISEPAGGGYVFAVKEDSKINIIADGNGIISCKALELYEDLPAFLIAGCVDDAGNLVER